MYYVIIFLGAFVRYYVAAANNPQYPVAVALYGNCQYDAVRYCHHGECDEQSLQKYVQRPCVFLNKGSGDSGIEKGHKYHLDDVPQDVCPCLERLFLVPVEHYDTADDYQQYRCRYKPYGQYECGGLVQVEPAGFREWRIDSKKGYREQ